MITSKIRFAVYKMPKLSDNSIPGAKEGYGFYYLDINAKSKLIASANSLQSPNQVCCGLNRHRAPPLQTED